MVYDGPDNDEASSAQLLPLGRTAIGTLSELDRDIYKFEASSGGQLSVNFLHPQGAGTQGARLGVELLDSAKNVVIRTVHGNDLFTIDIANGGTYYLKVADYQYGKQPGLYAVMAGLANNGGKTIVLDKAGSFSGTAGNDVVHGSTGRDVMTLSGKAADHQIAIYPGGATVSGIAANNGRDTLFNVERLKFADAMVALDVNGVGGQAYRLYEAAFNRAADKAGLGFWIHQLDNGLPRHDVAQGFINSAEFKELYGANPTNQGFVTKLYTNVLNRAPDAAGIDYWIRLLEQGIVDRAEVLISFADSDENVANLVGVTMNGMEYTAWGG